MIDLKLLEQYGAVEKQFSKGEFLFSEGDTPKFYFQLKSGEVKMNNFNDDGKEFIQGIFSDNRSFGEPPLLTGDKYPANAELLKDSVILLLSKSVFLTLLKDNPKVNLNFSIELAKRIQYKAMMIAEISSNEASHRILALLDYLKITIHKIDGKHEFLVDLTRQQIADLTGLRVETVIRNIKKLEKTSELKIIDSKVWR